MNPTIRTIKFLRWISGFFYFALALSGGISIILVVIFFITSQNLPQVPNPLNRIIDIPATEIFAANGERLMILGGRESVPLNRISFHFIQAILAVEDHRFWEHHGIDKLRTLKALWITFFKPNQIQGASTITQQLAKNLFFSFKQTYSRKFRELLVAMQIESQYTKSEILEAYLNQVSMGIGAYGIEQAAWSFFNKPAAALNLAESALLAGLPKSPARYNPYRFFARAKKRQQLVLSRMLAAGFIREDQFQEALGTKLELYPRSDRLNSGNYFIDFVLKNLEDRYGPEVVYHGGLKITTTFNPQFQSLAELSMQTGLSKLEQEMSKPTVTGYNGMSEQTRKNTRQGALQGAIAVVETHSGAIKALVGGRSYTETVYNRAVNNNRLPGSSFKPFLYYTAFKQLNLNPGSVVVDKPIKIRIKGASPWIPKNFSRNYNGPIIIKNAFMESINTIAAQLVEQTGPAKVIETARRCGITSFLKPVYSISLGTSGVSPLEMASSFATFANGGVYHQPFAIQRVEDALGRVLEEHIITGKKSLDPVITYQVVDMMKGVIDRGTAKIIRKMGFELPAAGKTGTTNGYKDAWFTGFTPTLSASVWVGFDKNLGLKTVQGVGITGGRGAAPIWANFMIKATSGEPPREFRIPAPIKFKTVDALTGQPPTNKTTNTTRIAVLKDNFK